VGGLGDVAGALPIALRERGHDVRIVMPRYGTIPLSGMRRLDGALGVPLGNGEAWCAVYETRLPGTDVPVYMLEHEALFGGRREIYDGPGGWPAGDNLARFAFLSRGAVQLCKYLGFVPDVIHAHDWPTALSPIYLNTVEAGGALARTATVLTVHNVAFQGKFPFEQYPVTGLGPELLRDDGLRDLGAINLLKGGLYHATMVTVVSPRFAQDIRTNEGGEGIDFVFRFRGADLVGILNGIDERIWDPRQDPHIAAPYGTDDLAGKAACKHALQREFGLAERSDVPLIDLFAGALDRILGNDAQVVLLGAGEQHLEGYFLHRSFHGGDRFRAVIGFDEPLSHRIEAGADLFLMPSRFEPCGLNQMYSMRYGTLPVARATGGLDDTIEQCNVATGAGTGFKFHDISSDALAGTVAWAIGVYRDHPQHFHAMQRRAMSRRFGWQESAARYSDVYRWAVEKRRGVAA
jgi:starch synthase